MQADEKQQAVIDAPDGHLLVLAGPGSGKTETLAQRVRRLLERGLRVLAITFTRKAAHELKERIGLTHPNLEVSTFHAFCHKVLRSDRRVRMVHQDRKLRFFGNSKSLMLAVDKARLGLAAPEGVQRLARAYADWLESRELLDFDDLISQAAEVLTEPMFDHVIVDEAQDNNQPQFDLLPMLGRHITLIGDLDQSIYGFRGAAPQLIQTFSDQYGPTIVYLENNYRCAPEICALAQGVIERDPRRFKKGTRPQRQVEGELRWIDSYSAADDLAWLMGRCETTQDFTVLSRSNALLSDLEERLAMNLWPSQRKGGLWGREGMRELRAHLLSADPGVGWDRHWHAYLDDLPLESQWERILGIRLAAVAEGHRLAVMQRFRSVGPLLSTVHGAKGLEWPEVAVVGLRDEEFPRASEPFEEELRLLFVALTRAKDRLTMLGDETSPFGRILLDQLLAAHCHGLSAWA